MGNSKRIGTCTRRSFITGIAGAGLYTGVFSPVLLAQDQRLASVGATVKTRYGQVRGLVREGISQFWGLAYGASTAGDNRFMPPKPPASWSGVQDHFSIGKRCYQAPGAGEPAPVVLAMNRLEEESEDCLNLNVFTPAADNKRRPVMVWMHGGGFNAGSGNYLMYDGTYLAKKEDVVVVSLTHRLNIFGFLHLADLGGDQWQGATNVGLQDLVFALEWVKENIDQFGGDPSNVTIFGQSGGGGKTSTVMATPSATGMYHRAIAQSGSAINGIPASDATASTERFLAKLGINSNNLQMLQSLTPQQIQTAYYSGPSIPLLGTGPVIDGAIIPRHQWNPTAPSYSADVPLMAGSTETENGWVGPPPFDLSEAEMTELFTNNLAGTDAGKGKQLLELYQRKYPQTRNRMLWLIAESDNTRRWNAQLLCRLKAEQATAASYLYLFNWYSPVHDNRMGAYHTLEIPFVFNNVDVASSMTGASQERYELAHVMSAAWAAFARTGDPNHADMPFWPAFNGREYPTMIFGNELGTKNDPNREERIMLAGVRA